MSAPNLEFGEGDNRLAGWRAGAGPAVLLLHGGPGLSEYLQSLEPELADSYTTIRYQQRGLAPSTLAGPFTVETHVADAVRLLDYLGLEQTLLIGHSWGGHLALHLMATDPERISAALVIDPLGAVPDGGEANLSENLLSRLSPAAAARAAELDARAMRGEGTDEDALESLALVWPGYFADPTTAPPMPPMQLSVPAYSETFTSIHEHFEQGTLTSLLPQCRIPTLLLLGAGSPIPNSYGIQTAALIPGAEARVLQKCGHLPWLEQPGVVRAALDELRAAPVG
ncbi:MAG: alpha/beta hydrolase [Candidatus Dormiibacterota bacterium]